MEKFELLVRTTGQLIKELFMGLLYSILGVLFSRSAPSAEQLGFKEDFDPPLQDGLKCCVCHHGLRNPKQAHCGHRFCEGCINQSISDSCNNAMDKKSLRASCEFMNSWGRKCPVSGCEHSLGYSEPYPDNHAKHEILTSTVYCRLKRTHGCPWKGPLHDLEYHLKTTCLLTSVKCDCGCEIPRGDLQRHVLRGCPRTENWRLMAIVNEHNAEDEVTPLQFPVREIGSSSSSEQITGIRSPVEHPERKELQNAVNECNKSDSPVKPKDPLPYQREGVKGHGFDPPPEPNDLPTNQKECGNEANCLGPTPEPKEQQALQKGKDEPKDVPLVYQKDNGNEVNGLVPYAAMEESNKDIALDPTAEPKDVPLVYQKEDGNEVNGLDPPVEMKESNKSIALHPPAEHKGVPLIDQKEESNEVNGLDPPAEMEESNKSIALHPPAEHKGVPLIDQKEESNEVNGLTPPAEMEESNKAIVLDPTAEPKDEPLVYQKDDVNEVNGLDPPVEMEESNKSIALHPPVENKGVPLIDQKEESNEVNGLTPPAEMEESNKAIVLDPTAGHEDVQMMYQKKDDNEVNGLHPHAEMEESNKAIALDLPAGSKDVPLMFQKEDGHEVSGLDHPAEPKESLVHQMEEVNEVTVLDMPAELKGPPSAKPTKPLPCQMKDANGLDGSSQNHVPSLI